jgi:hypothetical protein
MGAKKRLLLLNPPQNSDVGAQIHFENLGLGYLAASARKHLGSTHDTSIWDCVLVDPAMTHVPEVLSATRPDYVGLSLTTMNVDRGMDLVKAIKEYSRDTRIILGGILPSSLPAPELACFQPDAIIRGEGETLLPRVLDLFDADSGQDLLVLTQEAGLGVDDQAWPSRDMLPWQLRIHPQASLSASRGCPFHCGFCSIPQPGGKREWRPRDIEDVVEEMVFLYKDFGVLHFYFVDDNFLLHTNASRERAERFAELVLEKLPPVRFGFMCRSAAVDAGLFTLLKRAGLSGVFLGVESFSQTVLDRYQKQEAVDEHIRALSDLHALGVTTNPGFIFFDPWTDSTEISENLTVMTRLDFPALQFVNSKLTCYRGCALEKSTPPCDCGTQKMGIKNYAFQDHHTKHLFDECCTLFFQTLPSLDEYTIYRMYNYYIAYIQPYLLHTRSESLFIKYFNQCFSLWKQGDDVVLGLLQDLKINRYESINDQKQTITNKATRHWREGNLVAERYFRLAEMVLHKQMESTDPDQASLASLAFTSSHSGLNIDSLFRAAATNKNINHLALAKILSCYTDDNAAAHYEWLLNTQDDSVAAAAIRSAILTSNTSIRKTGKQYLERNGPTVSQDLSEHLRLADELFSLDYTNFILSYPLETRHSA